MKTDAIIAETTSDAGVQQVIILDESDESLADAKLAEVTAVNEDGTWSLSIYELSGIIAENESGGNTITVYHQTDLDAIEDTLESENEEDTDAE